MSNNDSIKKTVLVAVVLCVVCSVFVSSATVMLRPAQKANKAKDFKRNILAAAGLLHAGESIDKQFEVVETRVIDLRTGRFSSDVDPTSYDQRKAAKDGKLSQAVAEDQDIASISRIENYSLVYVVEDDQGLDKLILPIRGYGLWSTLRGFVALENDLNTVIGLGYYEHGETPGLGGEVDNPLWKQLWHGKSVYDAHGNVTLSVIKGAVTAETPDPQFKVDGLSGATLTSIGVDNMIKFWLGENGFGPFLANLKKGEA